MNIQKQLICIQLYKENSSKCKKIDDAKGQQNEKKLVHAEKLCFTVSSLRFLVKDFISC